jgi:hypothetical protein
MRLKAATLRHHIDWLAREHRLEAILQHVSPSTAALMRDPPLPATWIDLQEIEQVLSAIEAVDGPAAVRRASRAALEEVLPRRRILLTGLLRLFGANPATLYKRMNELVRNSIEGVEYAYSPSSEHSGVMNVQYRASHEIARALLIGQIATFEVILDVCSLRGTVGEPERHGPVRASYQIQWKAA